jgi:DNA repair protein RecO (recombination protein O)
VASTLAYVLHTRPWRETSLLVDALTQDFGRISLIAKGAKRPHSNLRGLLEPFVPLAVQYSGRGELNNLTHVHWVQAAQPMPAAHIMAGWYLSELCLRGTAENDPNIGLFESYDAAIQALIGLGAHADSQAVLRQFEYQFLRVMGLWPELPAQFDAALYYTLSESQGWRVATNDNADWCLSGTHIVQLTQGGLQLQALDKQSLRLAMRAMLMRALPNKTLNTRMVWLELEQLN